ncbi:unnamed protein product [Trichobilharzia regenti]|nr:unnamed protein product [Trichobilharzia regenti]
MSFEYPFSCSQSSQPEESSCSHNLSSLPSTSKTSPTRHHSGKRRQVSSPLEEHKRLNIESEFSQAPSKSRRGSSFRSPKSTVSRQHIDPLNSRGKFHSVFLKKNFISSHYKTQLIVFIKIVISFR